MSSCNAIREYESGRGIVLSITNTVFGELLPNEYFRGKVRMREGADLDNHIITKCFDRCNVEFEPRYNLTAGEIHKEIEKIKQHIEKTNRYKFLIILLASHGVKQGEKDMILGTDDDPVDIDNQIIQPFQNSNCAALQGLSLIHI